MMFSLNPIRWDDVPMNERDEGGELAGESKLTPILNAEFQT